MNFHLAEGHTHLDVNLKSEVDAPKFEDGSQEETEMEERRARGDWPKVS